MNSEEITATEEQIKYGIDLGLKIQKDKKENGFQDKGGNARQNADKVSCMGYVGETIYADYYDLDRPELIEGGLDKGFDFEKDGKTVQMKTTETPYLILFKDNYDEKKPDVYAVIRADWDGLKSFDQKKVELVHLTREEVEENHEIKDFGYGDRIVVDLSDRWND